MKPIYQEFAVVHRRDFASRFGLSRSPSIATLKRWQKRAGFPKALEIPRGYYVESEVRAWLEQRARRAGCPSAVNP